VLFGSASSTTSAQLIYKLCKRTTSLSAYEAQVHEVKTISAGKAEASVSYLSQASPVVSP
jgi:hypothetical protein